MAWLFAAISPSVVGQVTACRTSFNFWRTLERIFNTRSKSRVIQLQNQLRNLRKDNLSVDDYFARLTSMADELREAGVIIEDDELSLIALTGLDDSYESFITSQTARVDEIDFSALLGLLRSYEGRLCRLAQLKGVATANIAQSSLSVKPVQSSSGVIICQVCKKNGHDALACFNRHNEQ